MTVNQEDVVVAAAVADVEDWISLMVELVVYQDWMNLHWNPAFQALPFRVLETMLVKVVWYYFDRKNYWSTVGHGLS